MNFAEVLSHVHRKSLEKLNTSLGIFKLFHPVIFYYEKMIEKKRIFFSKLQKILPLSIEYI